MADGGCEIPRQNASVQEISRILETSKTVAVVGISRNEERPSHWISNYLRNHGYHVVGVNPRYTDVLGIPVYPRLTEVPVSVDLVDIFVRSENVGPIVDDAVAIKARSVWMQEGIVNNDAADRARRAGLTVVMNRCIYKEIEAR